MSTDKKLGFYDYIRSLCYLKSETCSKNQVASHVSSEIEGLSDEVDVKLSRKSDTGHTHTKSNITDLTDVNSSNSGLMTPALLSKLNNIEAGANKITVDSSLNPNSNNPVRNSVICSEIYTKDDIIGLLNSIETGHGKLLSISIDEQTGDLVIDDDGFNYYTTTEVDDGFTVSVEKQATADSGYAATYVIKQGGVSLSPKINIPKDFLVKSASVKTVTVANTPVQGFNVGDKYIDFVINSKDSSATAEHLYLNGRDFMDIYEADNVTLELVNGAFQVKTGGISSSHLDSNLQNTIGNKVDKVTGKGLSTNDFTDALKLKLENDVLTSHQDITGKVNVSDIKDNLSSTDVDKPLSANQGKELKALVDAKESSSNKVTSLSSSSTDAQYPSAKCVYDYIDDLLGGSIAYING